jgi:hypothetical protein
MSLVTQVSVLLVLVAFVLLASRKTYISIQAVRGELASEPRVAPILPRISAFSPLNLRWVYIRPATGARVIKLAWMTERKEPDESSRRW